MSLLRIVKIGGSLFDWPQLPQALCAWLDAEPIATNVLIAGGGALADIIRQADATFRLGEQQSHCLCLDVMGVTARLLTGLLAGRSRLVDDWDTLVMLRLSQSCLAFDVRQFLTHVEPLWEGDPLPHTWDVTSDSIAARVAIAVGAQELVLLKSCPPGDGQDVRQWAEAGVVDRHFPRAIGGFPGTIRLINLREMAARDSAGS